ncbi:fatty acid desaturase [bacterium]|nr:fatty acid desaturase [bacterium]
MSSDTMPAAAPRRFKPVVFGAITAIHLAAFLAFVPAYFSWPGLILCLVLIWATASLGASLCYHRLLSHKAWVAHPALRFFLLYCAALALQSGPITWSVTHRLHHRESDHEDDPHSPLKNFLWSHILWNFWTNPKLKDPAFIRRLAPDLVDDKVLQFFNRYFFWIWMSSGILTFAIGYFAGGMGSAGLQLGMSLVVWGFFVRTVVVWHNTWFVNSVTHVWGYRNYNTEDDSRNLWWVSVLTFGEGWHNNHHAIAGSARFGQKWWEFDPTWWALCVFRAMGLVKKVTLAPPLSDSIESRRWMGKSPARSPRLLRVTERRAIAWAELYRDAPAQLASFLRNPRRNLRECAALALANLGEGAKDAIEPLVQALGDECDRVREAAVQALVRIGDAAVPALQQVAQDAEAAMARMAGQRALSMIGNNN